MGNLRQSMTEEEWNDLAKASLAPNENSIVNHPKHYGGKDNPYEAIKVIEAWDLGFNLGNVVKYISRAGRKSLCTKVQDLEKAKWYLDRELNKFNK